MYIQMIILILIVAMTIQIVLRVTLLMITMVSIIATTWLLTLTSESPLSEGYWPWSNNMTRVTLTRVIGLGATTWRGLCSTIMILMIRSNNMTRVIGLGALIRVYDMLWSYRLLHKLLYTTLYKRLCICINHTIMCYTRLICELTVTSCMSSEMQTNTIIWIRLYKCPLYELYDYIYIYIYI